MPPPSLPPLPPLLALPIPPPNLHRFGWEGCTVWQQGGAIDDDSTLRVLLHSHEVIPLRIPDPLSSQMLTLLRDV